MIPRLNPSRAFLLVGVLALGVVTLAAQDSVVILPDIVIPMRDGVKLQGDVWHPPGEGRWPTLVYRTPYSRKPASRSYTLFRRAVERGYAVLLVDVRGRYGSEGEFVAYRQEGRDGYDTIEWASRQPWSDGRIGTVGLSYPGAVQWLAAMERPPHLKAMVPAMTFSTPRNFFYSGGVFDLSWIGWIWTNIAPDLRLRKNLPGVKSDEEARRIYDSERMRMVGHLPLATLPDLQGVAPWYFEWMRHPPGDSWWDWAELRGKYDRAAGIAVLNFSSWNDEAYGPEGATTNFKGLVAARKGQSDKRTALILGPWSHGVPTESDRRVGEKDYGPAAVVDYDAIVLDWMDRYLAEKPPNRPTPRPVRYFVMGADEWREADTWPLPGTEHTPFYLDAADGRARSAAGAGPPGTLSRRPPGREPIFDRFVSDAADPVPDPFPPYSGVHDYSSLAGRNDVLVYDSPPLATDLEVIGHIRATIFLSCDCPDTDLWVRLLDVDPDGRAYNLMSPGLDVIRASYRNGGAKRELLKPGRIYRLDLENLITGNLFRAGHRIRVQISASFFPSFSRNLHTGKLEFESAETGKAELRIHRDARHPSKVILPVISHP